MVLWFFSRGGVGGVAIKLTLSKITSFVFFVICLSVGWLMKPSKGDFGAPKKWALECQHGFPKLPGASKNMGIAEKSGSIPEPVRLGPGSCGRNKSGAPTPSSMGPEKTKSGVPAFPKNGAHFLGPGLQPAKKW